MEGLVLFSKISKGLSNSTIVFNEVLIEIVKYKKTLPPLQSIGVSIS